VSGDKSLQLIVLNLTTALFFFFCFQEQVNPTVARQNKSSIARKLILPDD
jgi:hypothetical protein